MVHTTRRRLLVVGGLAALTGCSASTVSDEETSTESAETTPETTTNGTESATTTTESATPTDGPEALEPLPAAVDDRSAQAVYLVTEASAPVGRTTSTVGIGRYATQLGLDANSIDQVGVAVYGTAESGKTLGFVSVTGSFGADEPSPQGESIAGAATHREDGWLLLALDGSSAWDRGMEVAIDGDAETVVSEDGVSRVFERLGGNDTVTVLPNPGKDGTDSYRTVTGGVDLEQFEAVGFGVTQLEERTIDLTVAGVAQGSGKDPAEQVRTLARRRYGVRDPEIQREGGLVVATGQRRFVAQDQRPDLFFNVDYHGEADETVIQPSGDGSVPASSLTVYVDGDVVENPWTVDTVGSTDDAAIDVGPFAPVRIVWTSPDDPDLTTPLYRGIVQASGAFDAAYDPEGDVATFRYTGGRTAPTEPLELTHAPSDARDPDGEPLSERRDALEPGDEVTVDGVTYGDEVTLQTTYDGAGYAGGSTVVSVSPTPPGRFRVVRGARTRVVYTGRERVPAGDYRITVGGSPADAQFGDEFDELSGDEKLAVDATVGDRVTVEWVGDPEESTTLLAETLAPEVPFEFRRDGENYFLTYTGDRSWDAGEFSVQVGDETVHESFGDDGTLTGGETVTVDPGVNGYVEVTWTGGEEPSSVYRMFPDALLRFEVRNDGGNQKLAFTGSGNWPASQFRVLVDGEPVSGFGDSGTVESGDAVPIDVPDVGDVVVEYLGDDGPVPVFEETVHPPFEFEFEYDSSDRELTVVSRVERDLDPAELSLRLYPEGGQPTESGAWQRQYETVTSGDSVTVETPKELRVAVLTYEPWRETTTYQPGAEAEDGN